MTKYVKKAQRCLEEPVLAAAGVQASGASGAALGGWALLGILGFAIAAGIHRSVQRRSSGLPLSPYMLLAVTADHLYLLEAGSTWRGKRVISAWDRDAINVSINPGSLIYRFEIPLDETRTLSLGARKGRGADGVAEHLSKTVVSQP
jgi:hypothetical protein